MAISDGNPVDAAYTNSVLASKKVDNTLEGKQTLEREVVIDHQAAPDAPASGKVAVYPKSDNKIYRKDSDGVEKLVGANTLDDLDDVDTTTAPPSNGQALVYNAAESRWEPADQSGGSGEGGINFLENGRFEDNIDSWSTRIVSVRTNILGSAVSTGSDTITIADHGYPTGLEVEYLATPGSVIGGLTEFEKYFVIRVDDNTISLATTRANALAGTEIDLTSAGGDTHQFRPQGFFGGGNSDTSTFEATHNVATPLVGEGSVSLEKKVDTSNTTFNGLESSFFISDSTPIDEAFRGRKLFVSGEYDASDAGYDDDLKIYFYDITNDEFINLNVLSGLSDEGILLNAKTKFHGFIAPPSDCEEFSLAFVDQNGSGTWTVRLDNLVVTPEASVPGFISKGATEYVPEFTGMGTVSASKIFYNRVGDRIRMYGTFNPGTSTAVEARLSLPPGLVSKSTLPTISHVGTWTRNASSVERGGFVLIEPNVSYITFSVRQIFIGTDTTTRDPMAKSTGSNMINSTVAHSFYAEFPIEGWLDSAAIGANEVALQTLKVRAAGNAGQAMTADTTNIPFIATHDPFNAWTGSTFVAPSRMNVIVVGSARFTSGFGGGIDAYVNGTQYARLGTDGSGIGTHGFSGVVSLNAGDVLSVRVTATQTLSNDSNQHWIEISQVPDLTLFASLAGAKDYRTFLVHTGNGFGSTANSVKRFTTVAFDKSSGAFTYEDSSSNGGSWTFHKNGLLRAYYYDRRSGGPTVIGISKNASTLTTSPATMTFAQGLLGRHNGLNDATHSMPSVAIETIVEEGDIIRAHSSSSNNTDDRTVMNLVFEPFPPGYNP